MPRQGITSFTVNPNASPPDVVTQAWVNDILELGPARTGPLLLRANVTADRANAVPLESYQQAFALYARNGIEPHALFTSEFDRLDSGIGHPNDPLPEALNNPYIDDFSYRATDFAIRLRPYGLKNYFIWNEPNDSSSLNYLPDGARFAALLYQSYTRIKAHVPDAGVSMGGLLWPNGPLTPAGATQHVAQYLSGVYAYLREQAAGIPWDAVNVHVHHCDFAERDMVELRNAIDGVFAPEDRRPVFVGEWGLTHAEADREGCTLRAFAYLRSHFDAMWYFQHPTLFTPDACEGDDWGTTRWSEPTGQFLPGPHCPIWEQLHCLYRLP